LLMQQRSTQVNESIATDCTETQRKSIVSVFSVATVQDIYFSISVRRNKDDMKNHGRAHINFMTLIINRELK